MGNHFSCNPSRHIRERRYRFRNGVPAHDIWLLRPEDITDSALWDVYPALLDAAEHQRYRQLRLPEMRRQYLLTRVLVRTTLSRYRSLPPEAWRFAPGRHGRPETLNPEASGLRFNVSHTRHLIACAVADGREIGVDVEWTSRNNDLSGIAHRFFSARECADLQQLPVKQLADRFFDYWTLKEAYIKARGLGLACPLGRFSFLLQPGRSIELTIDATLKDRPGRWRFWLARPGEHHRLAVCVERDGNETGPPKCHRVIPLLSWRDWSLEWAS